VIPAGFPFGVEGLLGVVAAGLIGFAICSIADARYGKI